MNKIQNPMDYSEFFKTSREYAITIYDNAPDDIKQVFTDILWSLLMKINIPVEEAQEAIEQLEVGGMGYLFENAEKMDIQAERKNTKDQKERAEAAEKRADAAEQRANTAEQCANTEKQRADTAEQRANSSEHILNLMIKELIQRSNAIGLIGGLVYSWAERARRTSTERFGVPVCPFGDCREGQIPRLLTVRMDLYRISRLRRAGRA